METMRKKAKPRQPVLSTSFFAMVWIGIITVFAVTSALAYLRIKGSVAEVERSMLLDGLEHCHHALDLEIQGLDTIARALAEGGDLPHLLRSPSQVIPERIGWGPRDLAVLDLSYISLLDANGSAIFAVGYGRGSTSPIPVPAELTAAARLGGIEESGGVWSGNRGLVRVPDGLLAFATMPIRSKRAPGAPSGLLVVARRLDAVMLARLRDVSLQDLEIEPVGPGASVWANERAGRLSAKGGRELLLARALERTEAAEILNGSQGESVAVLTLRQDRPVRAQGLRSVSILLGANVAGVLLAAGVIHLLIGFARRQLQRRTVAERLYRILVETAPDAIIVSGADGRIRFANAKAADLFKRGVEELQGAPISRFAARDDLGILKNHVLTLLSAGSDGVEARLARPDGSSVPVEVRSTALSSAEERDLAAISFIRDVSERKLREERILALTSKLGLIARLSQRTGSLLARDEYTELVVDSSLVLVPGCMPSLWLAQDEETRDLVCVRGAEVGSRPLEGGAVLEAFRSRKVVARLEGGREYALPIAASGSVLGVLALSLPETAPFDETDREALAVFADELAVGLQNGRLYAQALDRLQKLEALRTIDRAISSSVNIEFVLSVILEQARSRLSADAADILLLDKAERVLVLGAREGFDTEALAHTRLSLGEGLAGKIAAERRVIVLHSLADEPEAFAASPSFAEEGFVAYAGAPLVAKGELLGVLELYRRSKFEAPPSWRSFFEAIAGQAAIALENATLFSGLNRANAELRDAYESTIEGWAEALELRDRETEGHSRRVTEASLELAKALGLRGDALVSIRHGALLHDIGKMGIPDSILLKPGKLTEEEFETMKRHTTIGGDLLARLSFLGDAIDIPYGHHEKWDGTGYPRGLKGEDIPYAARLFSIVDVWDALCSDRPYRSAWPEEKTLEYLESLAGKQFDPSMVAVFAAQRRSRLAS